MEVDVVRAVEATINLTLDGGRKMGPQEAVFLGGSPKVSHSHE